MVTLNLFINTSDIDPAPMTNMAYQHYNFAGEADQHINHPYSSHTYYPSRSQDQHSRCDGEHQYRDNHDDEELMVDNKDTSSSDADEGTEDGTCLEHDQYLVEEDHIVHENYITHAYPINTVAGSIVADGSHQNHHQNPKQVPQRCRQSCNTPVRRRESQESCRNVSEWREGSYSFRGGCSSEAGWNGLERWWGEG
jgi:hypothetical protein